MAPFIFFALIILPVLEITIFVKLGEQIGLWTTIGLVILTAFLGTALLKKQGLSTLERARANLRGNIFPAEELLDGLCLLLAGALLITPGFATDFLGLSLFIPIVRQQIQSFILERAKRRGYKSDGLYPKDTIHPQSNSTIEGVYRDISEASKEDKD
jgi:UPF0716 protein FxsA